MKRLFVLMCAVGLSACASRTPMPVWTEPVGTAPAAPASAPADATAAALPAPVRQSGVDANGTEVERIPFRAGISSTTVEKMAAAQGCTGNGSQGAGLMTPQGPIEVYRMICDSNRVFMARCEFRQCRPMAAPPPGGYATPAPGTSYNRGQLGPRQVPALAIEWACTGCVVNTRIPGLIDEAYRRAAIARGLSVVPSEQATFSIVQYSERQPALRTMFGKFAGQDALEAQTVFRGKSVAARRVATESTESIEQVVDNVASETLRQLAPGAR